MTICNDPVQTNLVQIWCLELEHLMDACSVDSVRSLADFFGCTVSTTKTGRDQLFAVLVKQLESW